ncbi:alpha/beta fold hydrolase BchO [Rhodoplanes roseus]|uniref:Alpha/beta hydrolase n=1 Tax=Rhodoplanes roseus TaxID=29409 RepID=A0A327KQZ3_9BRAD|nr:alpha/beta fold hydrolase BchO [Rhodoplanes roseus]RAI40043.1 alpha/beta hydrolase [Rhodoplanes roseus]
MTPSTLRAEPPSPPAGPHPKPSWEQDGHDWPNRYASRFVEAAGMRWHVQEAGRGPVILLLHGTGSATHSWRDLLPLLARHFTVVAPDLPGHGFTDTPPSPRLSLDGMAADLGALLRVLGHEPALVAGHSAGGAVLARMCLDGTIAPRALVGLNAAMLPIGGMAGRLLTPFARLLASSDTVPRLFARFASSDRFIEKMITDTGSSLDPAGVTYYGRLTRNPAHVASALRMMANWRLPPLAADLPSLRARLVLITGGNDKTIAPNDAGRVNAMVPGSTVITLPGLGHLAHEEDPDAVAAIVTRLGREAGVLPRIHAVEEIPALAAE